MIGIYKYIDEDGKVTRTVSGLASDNEATAGIHAGEVGWQMVSAPQPAEIGAQMSIEALRSVARTRIDSEASKTRARYLSAGVGQDLTYQVKYKEALEYLRALDSDTPPSSAAAWPYVATEALATGVSEQAAAIRIAQTGAYWEAVIGPQIEATRIAGKDALSAIESAEAIATHVSSVVLSLSQI